MSRSQRLTYAAIAAVIAVAAVVLLTAGGGDDEPEQAASTPTPAATATAEPQEASPGATATATPEPEPTPEPIERIRVRGGEVVGGVREIEVDKGERVRFTVSSDVADHVHVHGYDILRDVAPGGTARFSFEAGITGIFEVELEESGLAVASLRVNQ